MFSPIHRRPIELLGEMRFTQNTVDGVMRNTFSGMSKASSINSMIMYDKKNSLVVPITNGMNNEQLFNSAYRRPRDLSRKGAELSVDYGQIPFLRTPNPKSNGKRRRAKTMIKQMWNQIRAL